MALKGRVEAGLAAGLLLVACVLAVQLAGTWWSRFDLTADQRHTLAPVTVDLLRRAPVEVRAFLPSRMPAPWSARVQAVRDMLRTYSAAAKGQLKVVIVDPSDPDLSPEARAKIDADAQSLGIEEADVAVVQGARQTRERRWFGLAMLHADRKVVVPPLRRIDDIEFEITRHLRRLLSAQGKPPRIGLSQGHGEPDLLESPLAAPLGASGELVNVEVGDELLPGNLDALVIVAPMRRFNDRARYVVDQFLMRGKAVVMLLDYRERSQVLPDVLVPVNMGLEPILEAAGVAVDTNLTVFDPTRHVAAPLSRASDGSVRTAHHPAYVLFERFAEHPVTQGLARLVVPMAVPLRFEDATRLGHAVQPLVTSAPSAFARFNLAQFDPKAVAAPLPKDAGGPFVVALTVEGQFASSLDAIPERPKPKSPTTAPTTAPAAPTAGKPDPPLIQTAHGTARLMVITSGRRMLAAGGDAGLLLQNAVDWAVTATDLAGLRARKAVDPPLRAVDADTQRWLKIGNVIGPAALLLLFGLIRALRRRRR